MDHDAGVMSEFNECMNHQPNLAPPEPPTIDALMTRLSGAQFDRFRRVELGDWLNYGLRQ
ncbi:hypothetical protein CY34DRAFT_799644 [Suillus luteus UH-Slu-Lm8-n1]|uniref:Uncharacterized protein n=1 Tax=Suillus luteus UH-Slu-Lm8-n1 TaxID=930992 RepID=A0A0D0BBK0_9AGAM|nr:hypothetical protein CY34DRAFT_799644 [Suillus luteus UH-Slu-Lm8-n1]